MSITQNNITISKYSTGIVLPRTFSQVEVTSDGRCFFGSVWLGSLVDRVDQIAALKPLIDKFNIKTQNNELNTWMQKNLIDKLDSVQQTCRFVYYVWLYQRQVKLKVEDSTLEDIIPTRFVETCLTSPNSHYVKETMRKILKTSTYTRYKNEFVAYYKSLNVLKNSAYRYAEPHAGLAQEIANSLGQNITIVNPDGVINEAATYWANNMKENNKKMIYVCKLGHEHYQALIPEPNLASGKPRTVSSPLAKTTVSSDPSPGSQEAADLATAMAASLESAKPNVSSSEDAELAAVLEKSRKEEDALKKKEEEDLKKGLEESLESAKPKVPVVPTTSAPPIMKCPVSKTNIPIYYVVFTGSNQLGDYGYMIKQPEYKNTLFIFNDNKVDHKTFKAGGGNAVIRPYNYYGWRKISGLTKPLSAGISTGDGKSNKGYQHLDKATLDEINLRVNDIRSTYLTKPYDQIIYSGTNTKNKGFESDQEDLLGIGIYDVSKTVREYITQQIKCLGDFRGKLPTRTPLENIKNAAIMLFVNNSANVVFVRAVNNGLWMLPGGQIDNYETPWAAAAREFREETGETLPAGLKETDFKPFDYKHNVNYTRIFIGKTKTNCPIFNKAKIHKKETDKLECRPLSDVIRNKSNYSQNIFNSTSVIYKLINENYENFKNYANLENPGKTNVTPGSIVVNVAAAAAAPGSIVVNAAAPGSVVNAPGSKKNVTFSSIQKTTNTPEDVQYGHVSGAENEIQRRYVMAANSLKTLNDAPFTSNPKQHIAMGTGAGLAVLAGLASGLALAGGRKKTHTRKKKKQKRARTRKHSRKTLSGFSLNKRQTIKKCYKTQKKRK